MTTEQKALALVNEICLEKGVIPYAKLPNIEASKALCRAIEQHEATRQEVERLNGLITATADHWLTLQVKHPIQWEGAINSAMAAACAEIEKHEAFRQEVSDAVVDYFGPKDLDVILAGHLLERFIIPKPEPDPLVEVLAEVDIGNGWDDETDHARQIHKALAARGLEIREKNDD